VTFDGFDVVVTPFPFADLGVERKRPALVLSDFGAFGRATGIAIIAMITTGRASQWPFDGEVTDLEAAGLRHPLRGQDEVCHGRFPTHGTQGRNAGPSGHRSRCRIAAAVPPIYLKNGGAPIPRNPIWLFRLDL
jgi:hypothetical protein